MPVRAAAIPDPRGIITVMKSHSLTGQVLDVVKAKELEHCKKKYSCRSWQAKGGRKTELSFVAFNIIPTLGSSAYRSHPGFPCQTMFPEALRLRIGPARTTGGYRLTTQNSVITVTNHPVPQENCWLASELASSYTRLAPPSKVCRS